MAQRFDPTHKAKLDALLLGLPGVQAGQMFGHPSYKIAGKIFASLMENGVTVKLPPARVESLLQRDDIVPFAPMGRPMRQWVLIRAQDPAAYDSYADILREGLEYVLSETAGT